ncbi:MAG: SDR family NAD(P)-dependent oxidoreductase [Clostridia bacterium]|nr:SDR family NAD(P)-dependent oxidoreductase [Clostridia bacterium]
MNKAVFITGAQSGTGYAIAETFARNGWDVFITSRNGVEAARAADKLSAEYGIFSK